MLFNSYVFIFAFLPATLAGFYALSAAGGQRPARLWLGMASLVFYGWWNPVYIWLIAGSIFGNYALGARLGNQGLSTAQRRLLVTAGVLANLLLLGYYKYAHFLVVNVNALTGTNWVLAKVVLPLGISFFTFTQIAFLIDAGRGEVRELSLVNYLLFVTFFPHLIAGPIIHHAEMMPQFARPATYRFQWDNLAIGLILFAVGLFKKVLIADALSGQVTSVFGAAAGGQALCRGDAWAGAFAFTFQIYFDFSGYSDMALGLARMFGITLPLNFNSPLKATGMVDFWRRWHITLSRWMLNYIFMPLQMRWRDWRTRGTAAALVVTFLVSGIWHGAAWTFVLWGLAHGLCLAVNHVWTLWRSTVFQRNGLPKWLRTWSSRGLTLLVVVLTFVLFRAGSLEEAGRIFSAMFGGSASPVAGPPVLLKPKFWFWLTALLAFVWAAPNAAELTRDYHPALETLKGSLAASSAPALHWRLRPLWACLTALLLAASILSLSRAGEFLYYNF